MIYSQFRPTPYDAPGLSLSDRQNWLVVPVIQTRDSGCLERSNFRVALKLLGDESDTVEIHSFNHWGPGWFEIILVHPDLQSIVDDIEKQLENYPILNEGDFSSLEYETAYEYWERISIRERMEWCRKYDVSIFAARRDEIPSDSRGELISALTD